MIKRNGLLLLLTALLGIVATATVARGEVPQDSKRLIESLESFEEGERFRLEVRIEQKRKEVAAVLAKHMDRETKAGNSDKAAALKEVIKALSQSDGDAGAVAEKSSGWKGTWEEAGSVFGASKVTVPSTKNRKSPVVTKYRVREGDRFVIVPNPVDQWTGGGTMGDKFCDYRGYISKKSGWMELRYAIADGPPKLVDPATVVRADRDGSLVLFAEDANVKGNGGEIRVVIVPRR